MDPSTIALTVAGLLAKKALEARGGKAARAWGTRPQVLVVGWTRCRPDPPFDQTDAFPALAFVQVSGVH
jgi:hypothetical protein